MSKRNKLGRSKSRFTVTKISFRSALTFDNTNRYSKRWLYEFKSGRVCTVYAENPPKLLGVDAEDVYVVFAAGWYDRKLNVVIGAYDLCDYENPEQYQDGRKASQ